LIKKTKNSDHTSQHVLLFVPLVRSKIEIVFFGAQEVLNLFEFFNPAVIPFIVALLHNLRTADDHDHRVGEMHVGSVGRVFAGQLVDQLMH
jgi:hypothetical protein